jgi:hypothetical protein
MVKAYSIFSRGIEERYADAIAKLRNPGDYILVVRGIPRTIVMSCPDGCGETLTINLDGRTAPAWRKFDRDGKLTIYPSVWKETGCQAHFIIWRDRILWCGLADEPRAALLDEGLFPAILGHLSCNAFTKFEPIAEALQAIPWEIYWACRELVRRGQAVEGKQKGTFRSTGIAVPPTSSGSSINTRA